jgi:hypothetical protein
LLVYHVVPIQYGWFRQFSLHILFFTMLLHDPLRYRYFQTRKKSARSCPSMREQSRILTSPSGEMTEFLGYLHWMEYHDIYE